MRPTIALLFCCFAFAAVAPARAQDADFARTAEAEAAANAHVGPRTTPAQVIPVPDDVSPELQRVIAAPYAGFSPDAPKTAEAWKAAVEAVNARAAVDLEKLKQDLDVTIEPTVVAGVKAFVLTPKTIPEKNRDRLVVALHGGGYVFYPGEPGTGEGVMIAGFGGFKVLAVDYRMPPDFPFPAALDDAIAVWKEVVKTTKPENVALIGTSAGGGLVLATVLRAKAEGLPLPGAVAAGTPWSDLAKIGDSYFANAWLDNVLVNYEPMVGAMARLYAGGRTSRTLISRRSTAISPAFRRPS